MMCLHADIPYKVYTADRPSLAQELYHQVSSFGPVSSVLNVIRYTVGVPVFWYDQKFLIDVGKLWHHMKSTFVCDIFMINFNVVIYQQEPVVEPRGIQIYVSLLKPILDI